MTIQQAQRHSVSLLKNLYEEREAGNITDLLLEHLTGRRRIDRLIDPQHALSPEQEQYFLGMLEQLQTHRPIQQVLGKAWFAGAPYFVNEHVLIPRPETEELIEWVLEEKKRYESPQLPTHTDEPSPTVRLLDIGTGSGCIPISLKRKWPSLEATAIDISMDALAVAEKNAADLGAEVTFRPLDILDENVWKHLETFTLIVSNPPYIRQSEEKNMSQNVLAFEPSLALFVPDNDALLFYRKIAAFAKTHLAPQGMIFLEINESLGAETLALFTSEGYQAELRKDMQGKDRMLRVQFAQ